MRIGVIVDGQAEYHSLKHLFPRIGTRATLLSPLYSDLQPHSSTHKIVRSVLPAVKILARKRADRVLIILDHENRHDCPPGWRRALEAALGEPCRNIGIAEIGVVLKVQKYENWLISDPGAMRAMPRRFDLSDAIQSRIVPDKADRVDALQILKSAALGHDYHKTRDAVALMARFDPYNGAANSRSLRRLLKLLSSPRYAKSEQVAGMKARRVVRGDSAAFARWRAPPERRPWSAEASETLSGTSAQSLLPGPCPLGSYAAITFAKGD